MNSTLRNVIAVVAGLVIGSIVNMGLVMLGPKLIAPPAGLDVTDAEALKASAHLLQPKHFVFPFLAHALGTLVGALTAFLLATGKRGTMAGVVGGLFLGGGIAAAQTIPAPLWFIAADLLLAYIPMAWLGMVFGKRLAPAAPTPRPA